MLDSAVGVWINPIWPKELKEGFNEAIFLLELNNAKSAQMLKLKKIKKKISFQFNYYLMLILKLCSMQGYLQLVPILQQLLFYQLYLLILEHK